jgi:NADH dehydrogenase
MILVTGAGGFVGRHVVDELLRAGEPVRALVHGARGARALEGRACELVSGDVTDADALAEAAAGCDVVVNLVAVIHGSAETFERVIANGTENAVAAALRAGARRFVQMSALGVSEETKDTVPYYRAKWRAEQAVAASGLPHTILRPSFVFGRDGGALPRFLRIARLAPFTPVAGDGRQRLQPIWVDDLSAATRLAAAGAADGIVELGGPDLVDWNELWRRIRQAVGVRVRPLVHLPLGLLRLPAPALELLPDPPVTRDQLTMLTLGDNVVSDGGAGMTALGVTPRVALDEQLDRALRP